MPPVVEETSLFKQFLGYLVKIVAILHKFILSLNDKYELFLSDKMLHFIFVACLGMAFLFVIYPLFKYLVEQNKLLYVAWIYVFTILIAITLLIEIGQDFSGTGTMDFADIMSGLLGFVIVSVVYIAIRRYFQYKNVKKVEKSINEQENKDN